MFWLYDALGIYTRYFVICSQEIFTLFLYTLALTWYKKKRRFYPLRIVLCLIVSISLCLPLGILRTHFNILPVIMFVNAMMMSIIFAVLCICYRESISEILLCFSGIIAAKNVSGQVFALLLNIAGVNDLNNMSFFSEYDPLRDWAIYFLVHIVLLSGIYVFLRKREKLDDESSNARAITLSVITYLLVAVMATVAREFQGESFMLSVCIKIFQIIIYVFLLVLRSDIFFRSRITRELYVTEQLLYQEKKHYDEMKSNIDVINMKCHDIRHQLTNFQGKLTEREIEELKNAIQIYDSNIKTGNEILDAILFQKQLYCQKKGIRLKYNADGKRLKFIDGNDLYALLSNALDNAVENVCLMGNAEKAIISLNVGAEDGKVTIELMNYFDPEKSVDDGTSKDDSVHHGYGIKSMRYIVRKYGGTLDIVREGDIFTLSISIPTPPQ